MKKNLIYLLILLAVGTAAYFAFGKKKRLFPIEDANFLVENVEDVTKFFLSDPKVGNIKLEKGADGIWMVNDSFKAQQDRVAFLLEGLGLQNASQMVPKSMHNNTIKSLANGSVKVEIFKGDKRTNHFYVGKEPGKNNITIMLNIRPDGKNAPRPFMVKYGVGNTFMGVRYLTDLENWLDKQILNFEPGEIEKISVSYPKKPQLNFSLLTKPSINVLPQGDSLPPLNKERAAKYLEFYNSLYCMGFENDYILKDTFVKTFTPLAHVEVFSASGKKKELKVFYRQVNKGTDNIITVDGQDYEGDSFFGWMNNRDFVLLSSKTVQKMLREHHEFFGTEAPPK